MRITDELRLFAADPYTSWVPTDKQQADLRAIADRIDAEHERVRAESIIDITDESMAEHGWVRLPKDADGEYVNVGDVMEFCAFDVDKPPVRTVDGVGAAGVFFAWCGERGYQQHDASRYRHYHTPTVEDVLREMADRIYADEDEPRDRDAIVAEYAKRLKLAGDEE